MARKRHKPEEIVGMNRTGLKLCGAGEWLIEKHGTHIRRSWRKLHIGLDADTGQIVASTLTDRDVDDASVLSAVAPDVTTRDVDGAVGLRGLQDGEGSMQSRGRLTRSG